MAIGFNYLLEQAGLDLRDVRLVRHQDGRTKGAGTPYALWMNRRSDFMEYQSVQSQRAASYFGTARYWAVFLGTPQRENLFVGIYEVLSKAPAPAGTMVLGVALTDDEVRYELRLTDYLEEYWSKLTIEWGKGALSWIQQPANQDKPIIEIRSKVAEPAFPGFLKLLMPLTEIEAVPQAWIERLAEAKGVYLITCPATSETYVGSATGEGGFFSRWRQHAAMGGDAVRFRTREPSDLHVSILEVAGSGVDADEIVKAEYRWIQKLRPVLNGHTTLIGVPKDVPA